MSHIPSSAMKHAGPVHHDDHAPEAGSAKGRDGGGKADWPLAAIGLGGLLALGALALTVPLFRAPPKPQREKKRRKKR